MFGRWSAATSREHSSRARITRRRSARRLMRAVPVGGSFNVDVSDTGVGIVALGLCVQNSHHFAGFYDREYFADGFNDWSLSDGAPGRRMIGKMKCDPGCKLMIIRQRRKGLVRQFFRIDRVPVRKPVFGRYDQFSLTLEQHRALDEAIVESGSLQNAASTLLVATASNWSNRESSTQSTSIWNLLLRRPINGNVKSYRPPPRNPILTRLDWPRAILRQSSSVERSTSAAGSTPRRSFSAKRRQLYPSAGSYKERPSHLMLQSPYCFGNGRLSDREPLSRFPKHVGP